MTRKHYMQFLILLALAALLGMGLVFYATMQGPGIGGDATIYLTSARNLLAGRGLGWVEADGTFRILPYTPPFYPLVLSGLGLLVQDLVAGARWLNIVMFGLTVFMTGWFFYRYTGRAWLAALLGGALAASPVILGVQVWAMSESLFLLAGFGGLFLLQEYFEAPRSFTLIASAALCGLAFLTRYIGVAFVACACLALWVFDRDEQGRFRLRFHSIKQAVWYGLIACAPILTWLAIDFAVTGTVGSRSGQPSAAYWQRFLEIGPALEKIYLFWLVPDSLIERLPGIVRLALWLIPLAALAALFLAVARRMQSTRGKTEQAPNAGAAGLRMAALYGLFIIVFMLTLVVVQVFTFPPITLASRMLSPVHMAVLVFVFALLHLALLELVPAQGSKTRAITALVFLGCLALFGAYTLRGGLVARTYHNTGIGYMAPEWQQSATLAAARELSPDIPIISNETTAIMFFFDRPAYAIQEIYQEQPQAEFTAFGDGDDAAQRAFRAQGGALVLFNNTLYEDFGMYGERVDERIEAFTRGLTPYYEGEDGGIYFFPSSAFDPADDCN